ncbi:MAG TPA: cupin domain-containing protein [Solirubrobacteraceae bacterium]|nr:cupin domain-containing protein [Solirubrobacteraceae bacterium]
MPPETPSPFARNSLIPLAGEGWIDDVPGIRAQETESGGRRWAVVEYATGARRAEWCLDGHAGFVLDGQIEYEFSDGDPPLVVSAGDAFTLATGRGHRGRNLHHGSSRLFLIDDPTP